MGLAMYEDAELIDDEKTFKASVDRIKRDLNEAARGLGQREARFLVSTYYRLQEDRLRAASQVRALSGSGEPNLVFGWLEKQSKTLEAQLKRALGWWAESHPAGEWAMSNHGIGPVLAAGCLAFIDIEKARHVGHVYRYAGLDPTTKWLGREKAKKVVAEILDGEKQAITETVFADICAHASKHGFHNLRLVPARAGEGFPLKRSFVEAELAKPTWNPHFKTLCWKIGDSFCKHHNHPSCFYGRLYKEAKGKVLVKNAAGEYAATAKKTLEERDIKDKDTRKEYEAGRLPLGRLELMARRYAVKIFLSHLHAKMYREHYKADPPKPYPIAILGHADMIEPPN